MHEPLKLGILGLGIMGERLMRAALAHGNTRVTAVWDPGAAAVSRLASITPDLTMSPDAAAVIAASDAVYIASPPASHIALGQQVLAAGRALFLEKPLASDLPAARAFVAGAQGQRAAVNFPMASSPSIAQLREWLPGIGNIHSIAISAAFAAWPRGWQQGAAAWLSERAEGGFTREVVSHFLFLTQRLVGPLKLEQARVTYPPGTGSETAIAARLSAGDVPVTISGGVGITLADDHNITRIQGARGAIRLRDWSFAEKLAPSGTWHAAPDALPNEKMRPLTLAGQLDKLAALTRGEAVDLATLQEALSVQEVVEAILAA
jgi:predicted dehydrogenase